MIHSPLIIIFNDFMQVLVISAVSISSAKVLARRSHCSIVESIPHGSDGCKRSFKQPLEHIVHGLAIPQLSCSQSTFSLHFT